MTKLAQPYSVHSFYEDIILKGCQRNYIEWLGVVTTNHSHTFSDSGREVRKSNAKVATKEFFMDTSRQLFALRFYLWDEPLPFLFQSLEVKDMILGCVSEDVEYFSKFITEHSQWHSRKKTRIAFSVRVSFSYMNRNLVS